MRSAWSEFIAAAAARGGIGHAVRCLRTRRLPPSGNHCLHDDPLARIDDAIRQRRCCPKAAQRTRPHSTDDIRVCRSGAVVQAAPDRAVQLQRGDRASLEPLVFHDQSETCELRLHVSDLQHTRTGEPASPVSGGQFTPRSVSHNVIPHASCRGVLCWAEMASTRDPPRASTLDMSADADPLGARATSAHWLAPSLLLFCRCCSCPLMSTRCRRRKTRVGTALSHRHSAAWRTDLS